jgi:hypothetical protein
MRRLLSFVGIILLVSYSQGQPDRNVTKTEAAEAKRLAVSFYAQLQENGDVEPLIPKFFIKDFKERLAYCRVSEDDFSKCGGFGKDFWGTNSKLTQLHGTRDNHVRDYVQEINYVWLSIRSAQWIALLSGKQVEKLSDTEGEKLEQAVKDKLTATLGPNRDLAKIGLFDDYFEAQEKVKSLEEYLRFQKNFEILVSAYRVVERNARLDLVKKNPRVRITLQPADFWIDAETNENRFFDYPSDTRMIVVLPKFNSKIKAVLKMDLIREGAKLRIVAVYPPID